MTQRKHIYTHTQLPCLFLVQRRSVLFTDGGYTIPRCFADKERFVSIEGLLPKLRVFQARAFYGFAGRLSMAITAPRLTVVEQASFAYTLGSLRLVTGSTTLIIGCAEPRSEQSENPWAGGAFDGMNGSLLLHARDCKEDVVLTRNIARESSRTPTCTNVDWAACNVADALPGVVPLTVALYRQGPSSYSRATCVPANEFMGFGVDTNETLDLRLVQRKGGTPLPLTHVRASAFRNAVGVVVVQGETPWLETIGSHAFRDITRPGSALPVL